MKKIVTVLNYTGEIRGSNRYFVWFGFSKHFDICRNIEKQLSKSKTSFRDIIFKQGNSYSGDVKLECAFPEFYKMEDLLLFIDEINKYKGNSYFISLDSFF